MRLPVLALLLIPFAAASAQSAPWQYEGKEGAQRWGKLDPAYRACAEGREQSPVDIRNAKLNTALAPLEFHYLTAPVTLENNGHTLVAHLKPGSYMVAGGQRYELEEFHFHTPSEEAVGGRFAAMSVHLVHRSAEGKLAVVAVRMVEDRNLASTALAALWPSAPLKKGLGEPLAEPLNPRGLLPANRAYWTYMGSLTTPPCTEGVRWFVLQNETSIGREQLRFFSSLFRINSRPLQDLRNRRIEASE